MSSEWQTSTLAEIASNISRPFKFNDKETVIFINTGDVLDGDFLHREKISKKGLPGQAKKAIEPGDILYSEIRPGNKRHLLVNEESVDSFVVSTKFMVIKAIGPVSPEYLYLVLTGQECETEFKIIADSRSGTFPQVTFDSISYYPIRYPKPGTQQRIVEFSAALTNKIQLNKNINQTLEQMAQAIFKSWFVDFEPVKAKVAALEAGGSEDDALLAAMQAIAGSALFAIDAADADAQTQLSRLQTEHPEQYTTLRATAELFPSAMQESELGEIPEGWSIATLADFGDVVCGKTPSKQKAEYYGSAVPFIKIPDMHGNVFVTKANEYLSSKGAASQPKKSIPKGSVCVSCIATVGLVVIAIEDSHTNQQINSIVPKKHVYTPYLYFRMQSLNKHLHDLASGGSATLNLNTSTFSKIQIIKPAEAVLEKYHEVTAQLLNKILEGSLESQTLSELRDTLLPKLLSGELSISAATDQITQAEEAVDV